MLLPLLLVTLLAALPALAQQTVRSPNGRVAVRLSVDAGRLRYEADFDGAPALLPESPRWEFVGAPALGDGLAVERVERRSLRREWTNPLGKRRRVLERANELTLHLREMRAPGRRLDFTVRAADDGVAMRYGFPDPGPKTLARESLRFRFPGDPTCWAASYGGYSSPQEAPFPKMSLSGLAAGAPYGVPLTVELGPRRWAALTEADLNDWAGMYLTRAVASDSRPLFSSGVVRGGEPARLVDVPVAGKKWLRLSMDTVENFEFDHADWAEPTLTTRGGKTMPLSALTPVSARQGWGTLQKDRSVDGNPLTIKGRRYTIGLGSHSAGQLVYALDGKYERFNAFVGIDDETAGRGSVAFSVSADDTPREVALVTVLSPRRDGRGLVVRDGPCVSPWRVVLLGDRPGALVESDLVWTLNPPPAGDFSWVKPGMCAWDHWWSGDVQMDTETDRRYIAFAAEMGWPYQLIDWQWYGPFARPDADILHINPAVDLPELRRFAAGKKVRLLVWLHSSDVDRRLRAGTLDEAFATYEAWGLAGVKIDFMDRDDQEMVAWYGQIVRLAAQHHLLVDFHGAFKPTGMQRTWPNQITREGVLGEEYAKFSRLLTPAHDVTLPFTRMLAGPMDYTPGGFRNRSRAAWRQALPTEVMGTRARELAKFIVYDSPLMVACDDPEQYRGQPGLAFLKALPTVWDETKVLDGYPGERIVVARRAGSRWFVAAMTDGPCTVTIPLAFLGNGAFAATLYADTDDPLRPHIATKTVTAKDTLTLNLSDAGGAAVALEPKR